jgi:hypothetical protein
VAAIVITLMMTIRDYARQKQNIQIGR